MLDQYLGDVARCSTINQFNRLHITLENVLAPAEICALIDGARARGIQLAEPCSAWLARMDHWLRGGGRRLQDYRRHVIAGDVTLYAAPGGTGTRTGRTLVVAYTGNAFRLMMPIALLLQHCPSERYEFLVLFDRKRTFFLDGIAGIGDDLPSTIAKIDSLAKPSRYRRAIALGTSAGGLAAIWTAVVLDFARAVSVGGATPVDLKSRDGMQDRETPGFNEAVRLKAQRLPEVLLVAGERHERDNEKALTMKSMLPATTITVPGSANHNVLADAWGFGTLDALLEQLLGDEVVPASAGAAPEP
ncbi:MAG: hypothetical protein ABI585_14560 [Betaproteobacteria bacterium]